MLFNDYKSQNRKRSSQGRDSYIYYNTNVEELSHKTASGHHKVEEYSEIVLKKKNPIFSSQNRKRSSQGRDRSSLLIPVLRLSHKTASGHHKVE